jgi:predicted nucleotidyltransferase
VTINNTKIADSLITTNIEYLKSPDFLCIVGSHLYGTNTEGSDLDLRGFNFMPKEFLLGVKKFEQHQNLTEKDDIIVWSAEKFVRMLINGSTIAFEMLFCPANMTLRRSTPTEILLRNTNVFISARVIKSILGYAQHEWRKTLGEVTRDLGEKRKKHIKEKGYSYKNTYHALRILQTGIDLGEYGLVTFPVSGCGFLKALKTGKVDFADVEPMYNSRLKQLEEILNDKFKDKKQDIDYINDLLCELNFKNLIRNEFAY